MIVNYANSTLRAVAPPGQEPERVSKNWCARFLKRHPEYILKKQKPIAMQRKDAENPEFIAEYFQKLKNVIDKYGIQPADIWNFDETGFRVGVGRATQVITRVARSRKMYYPDPENRGSLTSIEAVSAGGAAIPLMLIIQGKVHDERWYQDRLHPATRVGLSDTGYTNDELALDWLQHFIMFNHLWQVGAWRLLLFDGHGSHMTREFVEMWDENNIVLFYLPPHTTHFLQPLDVGCFQPLKHYHAKVLQGSIRAFSSDFNKIDFMPAISDIRKKTFTESTIKSSFKRTGIVPFNPEVVLGPLRERVRPVTPSTPPTPCSDLTTPTNVRELHVAQDL
jgi:hypothetical protein